MSPHGSISRGMAGGRGAAIYPQSDQYPLVDARDAREAREDRDSREAIDILDLVDAERDDPRFLPYKTI